MSGPPRRRRGRATAVAVLGALAVLGAGAQGAAAAAGGPVVTDVDCVRKCADGQPRGGSLVQVRGRNLADVSRVYFTGGERKVADLPGKAGAASAKSVRVRVPWETVSGELSVGTSSGSISRTTTIEIAPIPVVSGWRCVRSCASEGEARPGSLLFVRGVRLGDVRSAKLYGGRGRSDNRSARLGRQRFGSFRMRVPKGARTGSLIASEADGDRSPRRRVRIESPEEVPVPADVAPGAVTGGVFPIRGEHDYGNSGSGFGNARGRPHNGHDVFAACGTPLVAAVGGKVRYAGYHSAAGHYIVIDGAEPDQDYVYMHLQSPPSYATGDTVGTGARIGLVGETGNARGCHLHFELWSAPGWYEGGRPFDPLPQLKAWDSDT